MRIPLPPSFSIGVALSALGGLALAKAPAPPPSVQTGVYDPQAFPASRGEVERLTLTPRGDIDGFILKDGTEVKAAPDLSTQIAFAVKPGDRITVHGLKAAALPLVAAVSITDESTYRTITDSSAATATPPPRPAPPSRGGPAQPSSPLSETRGRVRMALHGPQGELNGALLENGAILRFPPDQGVQLTAMIQPHQPVVAEGTTMTNSWGTVVDVRQIGASREQLFAVALPGHPLDDRGAAGPRPPPPPPPAEGAPQPPPPGSAAAGPGSISRPVAPPAS